MFARMFGSSNSGENSSTPNTGNSGTSSDTSTAPSANGGVNASGPVPSGPVAGTIPNTTEKKTDRPGDRKSRRISSNTVSAFMASARNSLTHSSNSDDSALKKQAAATSPKQTKDQDGDCNNAAGRSRPTAKSSFRVGVSEDKNKRCRRTMEDTHAYLYNFLPAATPARALNCGLNSCDSDAKICCYSTLEENVQGDSDNGYFAIFDGHAGTFAADWCGKKLHHILEDNIRQNPRKPIPEVLDMTFTGVDRELKDLPVKNSGCTAVCAVLRWEMRTSDGKLPVHTSTSPEKKKKDHQTEDSNLVTTRVLYTANVGDARIVLCRGGKALRLSYDHKGSDENEGKRVSNAGGLILNNRVNGVLAVTRALGDSYIKELVTGHPYTTETVIEPDLDEFMILACDGLWDVCSDQEAVDHIRTVQDVQDASRMLVEHALARFSTDNLSCMVVRFEKSKEKLNNNSATSNVGLGVSNDNKSGLPESAIEDLMMEDGTNRTDNSSATFAAEGAENAGSMVIDHAEEALQREKIGSESAVGVPGKK